MRYFPILMVLFFNFTTAPSCFSADDLVASSPGLSHLKKKTAVELVKEFLPEARLGNERVIHQASHLLISQFALFTESDCRDFLSLAPVITYLQKDDESLPRPYKNILLALSLLYGYGQKQDPGRALGLIDDAKAKEAALLGLGSYLSYCIFTRWGYLLSIRQGHSDFTAVLDLMVSMSSGFGPAIPALEEVAEFSTLFINGQLLPMMIAAMKDQTPQELPTSAKDLADKTAEHYIFPMAMATLLHQQLPLKGGTYTQSFPNNVSISTFPCHKKLPIVLQHVVAQMRAEQQNSLSSGVSLFVNFTTLLQKKETARVKPYFYPLTPPLLPTTPEHVSNLPAQISKLRMSIQGLFGASFAETIAQFFKRIENTRCLLDRVRDVAHLERVYDWLSSYDYSNLQSKLRPIIESESLLHALLHLECEQQGQQSWSEEETFIQSIFLELAKARTTDALSLAHNSKPTPTFAQELYYGKILRPFSLLIEEMPFFSGEIDQCLKPKHAVLALLKGDGVSRGWANPETYIEVAYQFLKNKPSMVIQYLEKHGGDKPIKETLNAFVEANPLLKGKQFSDQLKEFVETGEDHKKMRKEAIVLLLLHLDILADTSQYQ